MGVKAAHGAQYTQVHYFLVSLVPRWVEVSIFLVESEMKESTAFKSWSYYRKSCVSLKSRIAFSSVRLWTSNSVGDGTDREQQNLGFHAHSGPSVWGCGEDREAGVVCTCSASFSWA